MLETVPGSVMGGVLDRLRTAVGADVVERPDLTVVIANDDDLSVTDRPGEAVAGFLDRVLVARVDPVPGEHRLPFRPVDLGIGEVLRREGVRLVGEIRTDRFDLIGAVVPPRHTLRSRVDV